MSLLGIYRFLDDHTSAALQAVGRVEDLAVAVAAVVDTLGRLDSCIGDGGSIIVLLSSYLHQEAHYGNADTPRREAR
jgi:hypothetical protein